MASWLDPPPSPGLRVPASPSCASVSAHRVHVCAGGAGPPRTTRSRVTSTCRACVDSDADPLETTLRLDGACDEEWHPVPTVFDAKRRLFVASCVPVRAGRFEFTGALSTDRAAATAACPSVSAHICVVSLPLSSCCVLARDVSPSVSARPCLRLCVRGLPHCSS